MNDNQHLKAIGASKILWQQDFVSDSAILIRSGIIEGLVPANKVPKEYAFENLPGKTLLPGLIDLQVNGGGGILFNNVPTKETVETIISSHRKFGTTSLLPTVVSDTAEKVARCISAVEQAMQTSPSVIGIHLEGPFFNTTKRGVHQKDFLRAPNPFDQKLYSSLKAGKTLVTMAPEMVPTQFIQSLTESGVIVAAGHSNSDYETTISAIKAGLTGFTHLFNAMPAISGRNPGLVTAALLENTTYCGIIADLLHVHPASIGLALKCKPTGHLFLVSDAMATIGAEEKSFSLYGEEIHEENGTLVNSEGKLAGSAISLIDAVRISVDHLNIDLAEAVRMASAYPARFMGLESQLGTLAPTLRADILCVDENLQVVKTWVNGED